MNNKTEKNLYKFPLSSLDCETLSRSSRVNKYSKSSRYLNFEQTLSLIRPRKSNFNLYLINLNIYLNLNSLN